jgi:hypothetical protein
MLRWKRHAGREDNIFQFWQCYVRFSSTQFLDPVHYPVLKNVTIKHCIFTTFNKAQKMNDGNIYIYIYIFYISHFVGNIVVKYHTGLRQRWWDNMHISVKDIWCGNNKLRELVIRSNSRVLLTVHFTKVNLLNNTE